MESAYEYNAYATLLTKPSQLPGVILLGHTIHLYSPIHPLIVLYTPSTISKECLTALRSESIYSNLTLHDVERLVPPHTDMQHVDDSWTKLRVFELHWLCYTKICFLDASILVRHDPELIFWAEIPENDGLVATHTCVCGLDHDASAPKSWMPENCAYNGLTHPSALSFSSNISRSSRPEHHILASGVFMFAPRRELYESLFRTLASTSAEEIAACTTSDPVGVFLSRFFVGRWKGVGYQFNAVTKMRRWHPDMWDDWSVCCLNYNAENPWTKRVAGDGIVEMEGKDNVTATHGWWWDEHTKWEAKRLRQKEEKMVTIVKGYVAPASIEDMRDVRDPRSTVQGSRGRRGGAGREVAEQGPHDPALQKMDFGEDEPIVWGPVPTHEIPEQHQDSETQDQHAEQEQPWQQPDGPELRRRLLEQRDVVRGQGRCYTEP